MKIAFVSAARSSHTIKWVNALAGRGHRVTLYSLPDHKAPTNSIDARVSVDYLPRGGFRGYFNNAGVLRRRIRDFAPDVVNVHYASGYGTLARLSRVHPILLSVWGSDVYDFPLISPLHHHLVGTNIRRADALASTSEVMAEQVRRVFGYQKEITITPFGVDCSLFSPGGAPHTPFTVGTVKALEEKYGMDYLIRGFHQFRQSCPDPRAVRLLIYGKGSRKDELQRLIDELGEQDQISLMGALPNTQVPEVIRQMDVFVLPSILDSESFGVSAVEAMACGVPVIASDVDGFRETVANRVTGVIVPRKDAGAIADALADLAADAEKRAAYGHAGRERALALYDFEKNVDTMEALYARLAGIN